MAFFNPYPATYSNQYYPTQSNVFPTQQSVVPTQPTQSNTGIIWVQGETGAKSYLVAPNSTVQLWDSEEPVIYLKSADASGMPSIKVIDYKVRGAESIMAADKNNDYVSRAEFSERLEEIRKEIRSIKPKEEVE